MNLDKLNRALQDTLFRLSRTDVKRAPYSYLIFEQFFTPEFYDYIYANMPTQQQFDDSKPVGQAVDEYAKSGELARREFPLQPKYIERLGPEQRAIWGALGAFFSHELFMSVLLKQLVAPATLEQLQHEKWKLGPSANLVESTKGYFLGPHTDTPRKILTGILYFAADDTQPDLGTAVYAPDDPSRVSTDGVHLPFEGFSQVDYSPYLPNRFFAFARTDNSFHGFQRLNIRHGRRIILDYKLFYEH